MNARLLVPALFFGFAGYCWFEATNGDSRTIAFSFIGGLVPSLEGDPIAQGKASAALLAALGVALTLNHLRRLRAAPDDDPAP